jgi:uncharacterized protein
MRLSTAFKGLFLATALSLAAHAQAPAVKLTPEHIQLGREVVEASGAAKSFENVIPTFLEQAKSVILGSNPDLSRDLNTIGEQIKPDFQKRVGDLLNNIGEAYARSFTADELKKIRDFYASPEGKKMVANQQTVLEGAYVQSQEWSQVMTRDILARYKAEFAKKNIKI